METKKKILIVDDDIDVITALQTILVKAGYEVFSAMSKEEGLEMLRSVKPNLAILDVMMTTQYEGFELAQEILQNPEFKDIPFLIQSSIEILVTSKSSVQQMAREYRENPDFKDLQVLLFKNIADGTAGIDYRAENGKSYWFPVKGFIRKPVDAQKILPEIEKHIR
ncbi:MAG: response regulator [Bacteroidales bacterium]|jgi:CheY-like chemotaxis protein|nr:response regulator [Bacteroidales bacterium]